MTNKFLAEWRLWIVIILVIFTVLAIEPRFETDGVLVKQVMSPASEYIPEGAVITEVNGVTIKDIVDYNNVVTGLKPNQSVTINYKEKSLPYIYTNVEGYPFLPKVEDGEIKIGLVVSDRKSSNLNFGLEIEGGTIALLTPEKKLNESELEIVLQILRQRLNVYGLKEVPVSSITDLEGNQYIRVEFAGATEEEVTNLISKEGKFEAKVGDKLVFSGRDVKEVCLTPTVCVLRIEPRTVVNEQGNEVLIWRYSLQVDISQDAANRFAEITSGLSEGRCEGTTCFLNETIDFYIDDQPVERGQLNIVSTLQGQAETSPSISGETETKDAAEKEIKRLQAILQSGSLPVKLKIEKIDTISPLLGEQFAQNVLVIFIAAIIAVDVVIAIRYRTIKIIFPMILITLIEIFATLGVAAGINWTLDLPSIAGIIAAIGTGVDDQIVITDEILRGRKGEEMTTMKNRIKRAFFIVFAAYFASVAAMIPLAFAGAGLLRGFAITTIIAISIGVLITRPAYARIMEKIIKE
jgi:preprotein translocase subunit SecD